jgi:hypothetical protein
LGQSAGQPGGKGGFDPVDNSQHSLPFIRNNFPLAGVIFLCTSHGDGLNIEERPNRTYNQK